MLFRGLQGFEVTNMYIKVNGFMVGRLVNETEVINPLPWCLKTNGQAFPVENRESAGHSVPLSDN